jgi:hypothetical protein
MEQVREISQLLVNSVMESNSNYPKIPVTFSAYTLTQIHFTHGLDAMYLDFSPVSDYVYFTVDNVSAQDQKNFQNITLSNSEVWQIGEIPIKIDGSGFEKNNSTPYFKQYKVKFILDGFTFTIEGKDLELIKRGIVANFFPEYSFDDLVLVSSMEKK